MKVYQAMANAFVKEGTSVIFGLLGSGQMNWWSEIVKHPNIRIIDVRNEGAGLSMAEGWSKITGKVGVCSTTHGPGVSRLGTSLIVASRGHVPVVVYASATALYDVNDEHDMEYMDEKAYVKSTGAGYIEVLSPDFAEEGVRQAFYRARVERRPFVLAAPRDVQGKECEAEGDDYEASAALFAGQQRIRPDSDRLSQAAAIVAAAKKPVILLGRGAVWSQASAAAERLAERIGALISTTLLTKGLLGESEFHSGISGSFASRTAMQLYAEADCLIAVGASLSHYTIRGGYLYPNARIVHIDVSPHIVMGNHKTADCYVQGDAAITLQELEAILAKRNHSNPGFRNAPVSKALRNSHGDPAEFEIESGTVDPREVIKIIDETLPVNAAIIHGSGHQKSFSLQGLLKPRSSQLFGSMFGCIGQALPTAIGAAVAMEGMPTVMIDGDGSTFQNIQELDTAARLGVKLLFIVMNDEAYGAEYHQLGAKGLDRNLSVVPCPDLGAVGRAFGCRGVLARTLEEVSAGIDEFLSAEGPMVLDIRISRNVLSIPYRRVQYGQDV